MGEQADAGADTEVRIPRSALAGVQRALIAVHAAVGLRATLQAIAEGVTGSTPYAEDAGREARAEAGPGEGGPDTAAGSGADDGDGA